MYNFSLVTWLFRYFQIEKHGLDLGSRDEITHSGWVKQNHFNLINLPTQVKTEQGQQFGYFFTLRSPNRTANQIRRSYKNDEFDWPFDFVTVTWKNNQQFDTAKFPASFLDLSDIESWFWYDRQRQNLMSLGQ